MEEPRPTQDSPDRVTPELASFAARHLRLGWMVLLLFAALGMALELLHAFKLGFYLDVDQETRRFMWVLAHAHGVGLAILNVLLGLTARSGAFNALAQPRFTSLALVWSSLLIPGGFLLGGVVTYEGDPGPGVWLVPVGALLLLPGLALCVLALRGDKSRP